MVPTTDQTWQHDPFGGELIDGYLWGRGTLDMKGAVVMMTHAFIRLARADVPPAGDGFFYLVRAQYACKDGSYDTGEPTQPAGRDEGVSASGAACP